MVKYPVVFPWGGGISCDEDDGLISVELEHAVVWESSEIDDGFENREEEMLGQNTSIRYQYALVLKNKKEKIKTKIKEPRYGQAGGKNIQRKKKGMLRRPKDISFVSHVHTRPPYQTDTKELTLINPRILSFHPLSHRLSGIFLDASPCFEEVK